MMVTVEVPLFGQASSSKMFGCKWTIASEPREYDVPEMLPYDGSRCFPCALAKTSSLWTSIFWMGRAIGTQAWK